MQSKTPCSLSRPSGQIVEIDFTLSMKLPGYLVAQVSLLLEKHIEQKYGSQAQAAREWGYTDTFVCSVLKGRRPPTQRMIDDAGIIFSAQVSAKRSKRGRR